MQVLKEYKHISLLNNTDQKKKKRISVTCTINFLGDMLVMLFKNNYIEENIDGNHYCNHAVMAFCSHPILGGDQESTERLSQQFLHLLNWA